jgi:hypothetical protein
MLRITVELIPRGIESQKEHLGSIEIYNTGTGNLTTGNYAYVVRDKDRVAKEGSIFGHKRDASFWKLIRRVLTERE